MRRRIPARIGSFEVEDLLGHGGMGVIYRAVQPELDRTVVLKALRRDVVDDPALEERFLREAQTAASIHHQNVVAVYDCFTWRNERYIAQEFVDGEDLSTVLSMAPQLDPRVAALIALGLVRGLEEIHARGIVHRDLKPSNVLIGKGGEVKIADFGIAHEASGPALTMVGHAVGTPQYMAPEHMMGENLDHRGDIFSFGVLLHEMLVGELPFFASDEEKSLLSHIKDQTNEEPRRLRSDVPRWLSALVKQCLRYKPKDRFRSTNELRLALEESLDSPSPADARAEIAMWLWDRNVFAHIDDATVMVEEEDESDYGIDWIGRLRAAAVTLVTATVLSAGLGVYLRQNPERFPLHWMGVEATGTVFVAATPWAEVSVDGGESLRTPLPGPLMLTAGSHTLTFRHPELGEAERVIEVTAHGEQSVNHRFRLVAQVD